MKRSIEEIMRIPKLEKRVKKLEKKYSMVFKKIVEIQKNLAKNKTKAFKECK